MYRDLRQNPGGARPPFAEQKAKRCASSTPRATLAQSRRSARLTSIFLFLHELYSPASIAGPSVGYIGYRILRRRAVIRVDSARRFPFVGGKLRYRHPITSSSTQHVVIELSSTRVVSV